MSTSDPIASKLCQAEETAIKVQHAITSAELVIKNGVKAVSDANKAASKALQDVKKVDSENNLVFTDNFTDAFMAAFIAAVKVKKVSKQTSEQIMEAIEAVGKANEGAMTASMRP